MTLDVGKEPSCPRSVVVVGAGFSGTMAAIHLRALLPPGWIVHLIERSGRFARGPAYADSGVPHLLNVRARNMSAFADDPGHFERWLDGSGQRFAGEVIDTAAGRFATRRLYGRYLRSLLHERILRSGGCVRLVADEAVDLVPADGKWRLVCRSGRTIEAAAVVVTVGNLPAPEPSDAQVMRDPWTAGAMPGLVADRPLLIVGTGLTMVDLVLELRAAGFAGPIVALSRRGLLPQSHEPIPMPWPTPSFDEQERRSISALLARVRAEVRQAAARGIGWRAVVDSLRPVTASLWKSLPAIERGRFLRHLRPYWDSHRHRMAPPAAEAFAQVRAAGSLTICRGRILGLSRGAGGVNVSIQAPAGASPTTLLVQRVIYATGVPPTAEHHPLIGNLFCRGLARPDRQAMGLDVTDALEVISGSGQTTPGLWAFGPIVRGVFWECTAVPDIRVHAQDVAGRVAAALTTG